MNGRGGRQFYRGGGTQAISRNLDELSRNFQGQKTDVEELRGLFAKMAAELEEVKGRVRELEATGASLEHLTDPLNTGSHKNHPQHQQHHTKLTKNNHPNDNLTTQQHAQVHQKPDRKIKQRRVSQPHNKNNLKNQYQQEPSATHRQKEPANRINNDENATVKSINDNNQPQQYNNTVKDPQLQEQQQQCQQPAEGTSRNQERPPRFKKPAKNFNKKPFRKSRNYNNIDSNYQDQQQQQTHQKDYPELSESEMNEVVQALKREFFIEPNNSFKRSLREIRSIFNDKGPKVVFEFVCSVLDHALCDVTSPTKLTKIATRFYALLIGDEDGCDFDFQQGFFEALTDISKREDDIAIDAPRYMDTLGQVLGECVIPMNKNKHRHLIKDFLGRSIDSYGEKNRAALLASIMVSIAGLMGDHFARAVWDASELNWNKVVVGMDVNEFMENHDVSFTTKKISPRSSIIDRKDPKELEKFADEVTNLVEKNCSSQTLVEMVRELNLEQNEKIDYLGTFIYAIVRGCLDTNSGDYKLNTEALSKYSNILTTRHEEHEAIALYALTALTKLWHHYNCPQDLLRNILVALHNYGTAPYKALDEWLNSDSLTNIPGIGAARLNSKRYIQDLGANLRQSSG